MLEGLSMADNISTTEKSIHCLLMSGCAISRFKELRVIP